MTYRNQHQFINHCKYFGYSSQFRLGKNYRKNKYETMSNLSYSTNHSVQGKLKKRVVVIFALWDISRPSYFYFFKQSSLFQLLASRDRLPLTLYRGWFLIYSLWFIILWYYLNTSTNNIVNTSNLFVYNAFFT